MAKFFNLDTFDLSHPAVFRFMRSRSITTPFRPTPRGIFDSKTVYDISKTCDQFRDPILLRAIFLVAFCAFFRLSNIAPHSARQFSSHRHFLRQDLSFQPPGAHILVKWAKTLQDGNSSHVVQLPTLDNFFLCPVRALKALIQSRFLLRHAPLFGFPPYQHIIDKQVRDAPRSVLSTLNISNLEDEFHTFRRSGATFATFPYRI